MFARKQLWVLIAVLLALAAYYGYLLLTRKIPCVTPIPYSLVSYDAKFGLTRQEIEADLKDAAQVWNNALGKEVLIKGTKPELPIYFDYDLAQYAYDTIGSLNADIDRLKKEQEVVARKYTELKDPALITQYYDLKAKIEADIAAERNIVPSDDIQEGRYIYDQKGARIYVYGFKTKNELMRTLIHEFGHALGLGHVSNQDSIMYPANLSDNLALTKEDKGELQRACKVE